MVSTGDVVVPPQPAPVPAAALLTLLATYGVVYPGSQTPAPGLNMITLSTASAFDVASDINYFLSGVYPLLQPNNYTPVALYEATLSIGNAVVSDLANFASVSTNQTSDLVPDESAKPLNAVITTLEQTYNSGLLAYITDIITAHAADIIDNPHHDHVLLNAWIDFFQALYAGYILVATTPLLLADFITAKTEVLIPATVDDFVTPPAGPNPVVVPASVFDTVFSWHTDGSDSSIHAAEQSVFFAETTLPTPTFAALPELSFALYQPGFTVTLTSGVPRLAGTLFLQATVGEATGAVISLMQLLSATTSDQLVVSQPANTLGSYLVTMTAAGQNASFTLSNTGATLLLALCYDATGLQLIYLDQTNTQQTMVLVTSNLYFDFDQILLGVPLAHPGAIANVVQKITIYPTVLAADAISLLFNSTLP